MVEYEKEFSHLSKYVPESVLTEAFRCRQFEDGLNESIKRYLAPVYYLPIGEFLSFGVGYDESREIRVKQQRKVSEEEVIKRSFFLLR